MKKSKSESEEAKACRHQPVYGLPGNAPTFQWLLPAPVLRVCGIAPGLHMKHTMPFFFGDGGRTGNHH